MNNYFIRKNRKVINGIPLTLMERVDLEPRVGPIHASLRNLLANDHPQYTLTSTTYELISDLAERTDTAVSDLQEKLVSGEIELTSITQAAETTIERIAAEQFGNANFISNIPVTEVQPAPDNILAYEPFSNQLVWRDINDIISQSQQIGFVTSDEFDTLTSLVDFIANNYAILYSPATFSQLDATAGIRSIGNVRITGSLISDNAVINSNAINTTSTIFFYDGITPFTSFIGFDTVNFWFRINQRLHVNDIICAQTGIWCGQTDVMAAITGGGVTDHGALTGLFDDDHPQYVLTGQFVTHTSDTTIHFTEGSIDHGSIAGLADDDHPQYALRYSDVVFDNITATSITTTGTSMHTTYLEAIDYVSGNVLCATTQIFSGGVDLADLIAASAGISLPIDASAVTAGRFSGNSSALLSTPGDFSLGWDLYIGSSSTSSSSDAFIYFKDGGSPTSRYVRWNTSNNRFEFSNDIHSLGSLLTSDRLWFGYTNAYLFKDPSSLAIIASDGFSASTSITASTYYCGTTNLADLISSAGITGHSDLSGLFANDHPQYTLTGQFVTHTSDTTIHFTEASIDHGSIAGLADDDHPQYALRYDDVVFDNITATSITTTGTSIHTTHLEAIDYVSGNVLCAVTQIYCGGTSLQGLLDTVASSSGAQLDSNVSFANLTADTLSSRGNIYVNVDGPDGDSTLYFYDVSSPTGRYLRWSDTTSRFQFNNALQISSFLDVDGYLDVLGNVFIRSQNMYLNYANTDADQFIYFRNNSDNESRYFKWDDADDRFEINDQLNIDGNLVVTGTGTFNLNSTNGELQLDTSRRGYALDIENIAGGWARGHVFYCATTMLGGYHGYGASAGVLTRLQMGNDFGTASGVTVLLSNGYVGINNLSPSYPLDVNGNARAQGNVFSNDNIYINHNGGDQDSFLYFYDGGSSTGKHLRWIDSTARFRLNAPLELGDGTSASTGGIYILDDRNADHAPSAYTRSATWEFKSRAAVGVGGTGTFGALHTVAPWSDDSGGSRFQYHNNAGGLYWRHGTQGAGWQTWNQVVFTGSDVQFGIVSASTIFSGDTDLADIIADIQTDGVIISSFTSNGTWTKPSGAKYIVVHMWGGGGGGGSGSVGVGSGGGGGGAGGMYARYEYTEAQLNSSETVVVGSGGTGGVAVGVAPGMNGTSGGNSTFKNNTAYGGGFGERGTVAAGTGGVVPLASAVLTMFGYPGAGGTAGDGTVGSPGTRHFNAGGGGGGGGGHDDVSAGFAGGAGGGHYTGTTATGGGAGAASISITMGGDGASGGAGSYNVDATAGGNGGNPAGGGGGGGSTRGISATEQSGAGGNGAAGRVIIITYI